MAALAVWAQCERSDAHALAGCLASVAFGRVPASRASSARVDAPLRLEWVGPARERQGIPVVSSR